MSAYESGAPLTGEHEEQVREIARQEIASLSGLVLRRLQDEAKGLTRLEERNIAMETTVEILASIFGEALKDFGGSASEPGV